MLIQCYLFIICCTRWCTLTSLLLLPPTSTVCPAAEFLVTLLYILMTRCLFNSSNMLHASCPKLLTKQIWAIISSFHARIPRGYPYACILCPVPPFTGHIILTAVLLVVTGYHRFNSSLVFCQCLFNWWARWYNVPTSLVSRRFFHCSIIAFGFICVW